LFPAKGDAAGGFLSKMNLRSPYFPLILREGQKYVFVLKNRKNYNFLAEKTRQSGIWLILHMTMKETIYLDNAATTPLLPEVVDVMHACLRDVYGNPSSVHAPGRKARVEVEGARRTISKLMQASPGEIFFTSGGTEANNAILWGCLRDLKRTHFITTGLEHPAVLQTLEAMVKYSGASVSMVDVDAAGRLDLEHLEFLLKQHSGAVVSLMHANNEIGNLLPVKEVGVLCRRYDALFHSDTVQTAGKFALNMKQLPFDFAVASAHKFHGPKGVGFMYVRPGRFFRPFINGGGQERSMRAGTENVYGIVGMARAFQLAHATMEEDQQHIRRLRKQFIDGIRERLPGTAFNGDAEGSALHTIVNVLLPPGIDAEMLLPRLDMEGISISSGSACSSGSTTSSHVLTALGTDQSRPSVRVSFSRFNTAEEVDRLTDVLVNFYQKS
jgi:cysteine desulfurase